MMFIGHYKDKIYHLSIIDNSHNYSVIKKDVNKNFKW